MHTNIKEGFYRNRFFLLLSGLTLLLYAFFSALAHLATKYFLIAELSWPFVLLLCAVIPALSFNQVSSSYKILCRSIAIVAFVYVLLQFPLYPVVNQGIYTSLLSNVCAWIIALITAVLSLRNPTWLLALGFYLPWVKALADHASGFSYHNLLDIIPLYQLLMFCGTISIVIIACRLLIKSLGTNISSKVSSVLLHIKPEKIGQPLTVLLVFIVVSFHFAGYLFSGVAKASLDGGFLYWPMVNKLQNIYFAGVVNKQMVWLDIPNATLILTNIMDWIGPVFVNIVAR